MSPSPSNPDASTRSADELRRQGVDDRARGDVGRGRPLACTFAIQRATRSSSSKARPGEKSQASPPMVIRRGGRQDVRFLRDMLHHAYYWRERNPGDGPGPAARYVKGWGRPGDTVLIAIDDGFPVGADLVPAVPARPPGLRLRGRGDARARDRGGAEPPRARDRRGAARGALRARSGKTATERSA